MEAEWRVRGIRGATTASENTEKAITEVVEELLDELFRCNDIEVKEIINVIFTATRDLDAVFPAKIARRRRGWDFVPLLDLQQMHVKGALEHCIRVLIQVNTPTPQTAINHCYLRGAESLRPDLLHTEFSWGNSHSAYVLPESSRS